MTAVVAWFEAIVSSIPLPMLEVWGRFAFVVGLFLAICAFGGFTFRIGEHWGFGRARQRWDTKAFLSMPLTFVLIIATGYIGSFIVLVPGAQTFESLKDLAVLLSVVLLGYPALITIPFAYGLSDLIEGVPPEFLLAWLPGYFINPACFWIAHQLLGKNPDFRIARTWWRYLAAAALFMTLEPMLWGYECSDQFPSGISYHRITAALLFTTSITWVMGPVAFLAALPLARRFGWFWAEIPGHVKERAIGTSEWIWESGRGEMPEEVSPIQGRFPIRIFIFAPFIALVLVMVGATAIVALQTADDDAQMLATRLHQAMSANIRLQLDDYVARSPPPAGVQREETLDSLLRSEAVGTNGRAIILDMTGKTVASSASAGDPVVANAIAALAQHTGPSRLSGGATEFQFDHITAKPLSRETWLTYATAYRDHGTGHDWILMTAMPESFYLAGLRKANSRSAMVLALALVLALVLGAVLASMVTAPLRHMAHATRTMAGGDMSVRVPGAKLEELDALAESFNAMAAKLKTSFDDLVAEVAARESRERELKESEARLGLSEERLKLAIDAASLGIWDWDVERDRLVWDDSMYRLYGVRKEEFSGAFDAWSKCIVPEDVEQAKADVEAALRGDRDYLSDFKVQRADGAIRIIRGVAQIIRAADGRPVRMVGINRDVTDLIDAERERVRANEELQAAQAELAHVARLTTMGELAASIAHEINQPLGAILTNAETADAILKSQSPDIAALPAIVELKDIVNDILHDDRRAGEVIRRIRSLVTKAPFELKNLDLNDLVRDTVELLTSVAVARKVELVSRIAQDVLPILGDRIQLQQVILNLVVNGIDGMKDTPSENRIVSIRTSCVENFAQLSVSDRGSGIPKDKLKTVFEPFYTNKAGGMGMGLSIAHTIIEAHQGLIWAENRDHGGASFRIRLPLVQ
jgi:two-component system sensor histidine kinase/response regulator